MLITCRDAAGWKICLRRFCHFARLDKRLRLIRLGTGALAGDLYKYLDSQGCIEALADFFIGALKINSWKNCNKYLVTLAVNV